MENLQYPIPAVLHNEYVDLVSDQILGGTKTFEKTVYFNKGLRIPVANDAETNKRVYYNGNLATLLGTVTPGGAPPAMVATGYDKLTHIADTVGQFRRYTWTGS